MRDSLTVEIWTDLICPWCWIGERRFERALAGFPQHDRVRVVHRAFRLMPGGAPEPARDMLARRFGSVRQAQAMMAHVESEAHKEGLAYRLEHTWTGDTLDAHRLVKLADSLGLGERAVAHCYQAYFCDGRSLFERASLLKLAEEIGLAATGVEEMLDGDASADAVVGDQRTVQELGATGVPFFVFDGRIAVSGAQGAPAFLEALERAREERDAWAAGGADVCGPEGCAGQ